MSLILVMSLFTEDRAKCFTTDTDGFSDNRAHQ